MLIVSLAKLGELELQNLDSVAPDEFVLHRTGAHENQFRLPPHDASALDCGRRSNLDREPDECHCIHCVPKRRGCSSGNAKSGVQQCPENKRDIYGRSPGVKALAALDPIFF